MHQAPSIRADRPPRPPSPQYIDNNCNQFPYCKLSSFAQATMAVKYMNFTLTMIVFQMLALICSSNECVRSYFVQLERSSSFFQIEQIKHALAHLFELHIKANFYSTSGCTGAYGENIYRVSSLREPELVCYWLIISFSPYLSSAMVRFPFEIHSLLQFCHVFTLLYALLVFPPPCFIAKTDNMTHLLYPSPLQHHSRAPENLKLAGN